MFVTCIDRRAVLVLTALAAVGGCGGNPTPASSTAGSAAPIAVAGSGSATVLADPPVPPTGSG
nr:hypothetical protein [Deltaproteobacteria bacterium]